MPNIEPAVKSLAQIRKQAPASKRHHGQVTFANLAPGVHTVTATGVVGGPSPVQAVIGTLTAWSRAWETE